MNSAYERLLVSRGRPVVREEAAATRASEIELQARFRRGEFGVDWLGEDGESIRMIHPGRWNREAGPDFCDARIEIAGRAIRGDIEIDFSARDWEAHGHSGNPAFNDVALHVFFRRGARRVFTRTSENRSVPQVCLPPAASRVSSSGLVEGDRLDLEGALTLVEAAARHRLARKRAAHLRAAALVGDDEALFQNLAAGLGYKHNKFPFLLVAQRAGKSRATDWMLFGLAGFLDAEQFDTARSDVRGYLADLWENWWKVRDREARLVLPRGVWRLSGVRPANHPHRRLGALGAIARHFTPLAGAVRNADGRSFLDQLKALGHPFWNRHWNLSASPLKKESALIGADRARDLALNAFLPSLPPQKSWDQLSTIPAPAPNQKVRLAWEWLCGAELPDTAMHQQGLIQLYDDFFPESPADLWDGLERG